MRAWHVWPVLVLALAAAVLGLATNNSPAEIAALAVLAVLLLGGVYRLLLSGEIEGERRLVATVIPWGGSLTQVITLTNRSRLRVTGVRVVDDATLPQHPTGYVASLPGRRSLTWDVSVPCRTRGRYQVGPLTASTADPLGLFPATRTVEQGKSVLVLPRWVQLTRCALALDGALPGDFRGHHHQETPLNVAGIRAYEPGDPVAKIHWRASARAGSLLTKQFDQEVQSTLWLALDLDGALPPETEELLVTIATSLGMYALQQKNLHVGLLASGTVPVVLQPARDRAHQRRLQEHLAEVHAGTRAALLDQLAAINRYIRPQHVLILITSQNAGVWASRLPPFLQRGVAVRAVQIVDNQERPAGLGRASMKATHPPSQPAWPVPHLRIPVALSDPLRAESLVSALELGLPGEQIAVGLASTAVSSAAETSVPVLRP